MKIETAELKGAALDWAVAKCEGWLDDCCSWLYEATLSEVEDGSYKPSTDWSQGGEIIQREKITIVCAEGDYNPKKSGTPDCYDTYWVADKGRLTTSTVYGSQGDDFGNFFQVDCNAISGSTPLIAAMRCYVLSRLGEEVEVPDELTNQ